MKKAICSVLLVSMMANPIVAKADSDDAAWAIGGLIVGMIIGNNNHDDHDEDDRRNPPERRPTPPPHREPRRVPIYSTVCEYHERYDSWGNRLTPFRYCHRVITGYREVY